MADDVVLMDREELLNMQRMTAAYERDRPHRMALVQALRPYANYPAYVKAQGWEEEAS